MLPEPHQIRAHELTLKRGGCYEQAAVDALIDEVGDAYCELWLQREDMTLHVAALEAELDGYRRVERQLGRALIVAEAAAERARERAKTQADLLTACGRAERDSLHEDIDRLRAIRREMVTCVRALVLAGLQLLEEDVADRAVPTNGESPARASASLTYQRHAAVST